MVPRALTPKRNAPFIPMDESQGLSGAESGKAKQFGSACTPAMAAGLTDHIWTVQEVLTYKIAPLPWVEPKPAGRSRKKALSDPLEPKRPRGRPRKHPLPDPTLPKRPRGRPRKLA